MSGDTIVSRAKKLVDDGDVEFVNVNGNTFNFQGKGHNVSKDEVYLITAEIQENNEIEWSCSCHHAQFNDECKHMLACGSNNDSWSLLIKKQLKRNYNDRITNDEYYNEHKDDMIVMIDKDKIKIESDDD